MKSWYPSCGQDTCWHTDAAHCLPWHELTGTECVEQICFFQWKQWRDSDVWSEENQISCNKYLEMLVFFVCRISKAPSSPPFYLSSRRFPASVGSGCWRPRLRWLLSDAATTGAPAPARPARRWGHRGSVFPNSFFFPHFVLRLSISSNYIGYIYYYLFFYSCWCQTLTWIIKTFFL